MSLRFAAAGAAALVAVLAGAPGLLAQSDAAAKADMAADALRLLQQHDAAAAGSPPSPRLTFLAPTPAQSVGEAEFARFLESGAASMAGVHVRDDPAAPPERDPYFEGSFKRTRHAYLDRVVATYDEGVYAVPGEAAYVGTFSYFGQPTEEWEIHPKGSFVIVGKKLGWDGRVDTGIYIAERATAGFALLLTRATPEYLDGFERRHAAAVESYRRQLAEEAAGGGLDFGAVLALGFGAALIGSSDLPGLDKLELGQAFVSDVLGQGDGRALLGIASSGLPGRGGAGGVFSGSRSFQAPGLDSLHAGAVTGQGAAAEAGFAAAVGSLGQAALGSAPTPSPTPSPAASAAPGTKAGTAAARTETVSFTCPAGDRHSLPVTYRDPGCGAAMKRFAEVYSCNLIGDFAAAGEQCRRACGHPQCAEGQ